MQPFAYERIDESTWMYVSSFLILSFFFKFNRMWSIRNLDLFLIILLAPGLLLIQSGVQMHQKFIQETAQRLQENEEDRYKVPPPVKRASFAANTEQDASPPSSQADPLPVVPGADTDREPTLEEKAPESRWLYQPGLDRQRLGYLWMFVVGGLLLVRLLVDPLFERRPLLEPNLSIGGMVFLGFSLLFFVLANVATYSPAEEDLQEARNAVKMLKREVASDSEDKH